MTMTTEDIELILLKMGIPYYCASWRIACLIGIPPWKIRHAIDSGSLRRAGDGTVTRRDLAEWIRRQPALCSKLAGEPEMSDEKPLTLTPAALDPGIVITIGE